MQRSTACICAALHDQLAFVLLHTDTSRIDTESNSGLLAACAVISTVASLAAES